MFYFKVLTCMLWQTSEGCIFQSGIRETHVVVHESAFFCLAIGFAFHVVKSFAMQPGMLFLFPFFLFIFQKALETPQLEQTQCPKQLMHVMVIDSGLGFIFARIALVISPNCLTVCYHPSIFCLNKKLKPDLSLRPLKCIVIKHRRGFYMHLLKRSFCTAKLERFLKHSLGTKPRGVQCSKALSSVLKEK